MYNINNSKFSKGSSEKLKKYDLKEASKIYNIKGVGRNKLYHIMREMGLVNDSRWPAEKYIEEGYLEGIGVIHDGGRCVPKTLIVGEKGLDFVRKLVEEYLEDPDEATKNVVKPPIEYIDNSGFKDI